MYNRPYFLYSVSCLCTEWCLLTKILTNIMICVLFESYIEEHKIAILEQLYVNIIIECFNHEDNGG